MAKTFVDLVGGVLTVRSATASGGAGNANQVVALDGTGAIDASMLGGTFVASLDVSVVVTASIGAMVYINSAGKIALAVASSLATQAQGFIKDNVSVGETATVYFSGENTNLSGLTIGAPVFLDAAAIGKVTLAAPGNPNMDQPLGFAVSATQLHFRPDTIVVP